MLELVHGVVCAELIDVVLGPEMVGASETIVVAPLLHLSGAQKTW